MFQIYLIVSITTVSLALWMVLSGGLRVTFGISPEFRCEEKSTIYTLGIRKLVPQD